MAICTMKDVFTGRYPEFKIFNYAGEEQRFPGYYRISPNEYTRLVASGYVTYEDNIIYDKGEPVFDNLPSILEETYNKTSNALHIFDYLLNKNTKLNLLNLNNTIKKRTLTNIKNRITSEAFRSSPETVRRVNHLIEQRENLLPHTNFKEFWTDLFTENIIIFDIAEIGRAHV